MLTHLNVLSNMHQFQPFEKDPSNLVILAVLPFYHIYALFMFLHWGLWNGVKLVVQSKFDMVNFLKLIEKHKVNYTFIVPPIAIGMAKHPAVDAHDISSLKVCVSAAAPLGSEATEEFKKRLPNIIIKQG